MIRAHTVEIRQVNEKDKYILKRDKNDQKEDGRNRRHEKETHMSFWIPYGGKHSTNEMKELYRGTI